MSQVINYLKDYQALNYSIPDIRMSFDVYPEHTLVISELDIQPQHSIKDLILKGSAQLLSVAINNTVLTQEAYSLTNDVLTIYNIPNTAFTVRIETKLFPKTNKTLMGLYESESNLYTQCEPEGFRKITYHPDRPDMMSRYTVRIEADAKVYPVLLSNGNKTATGSLPNNRHFAEWHDPFAKPSYLFALVAGNLTLTQDTFTTKSGRQVAIEFFTRPEDADKVDFAIQSLKHAMRWDETRFGLEYDLDIYMVVAVSDFNMGAMENKGLNIFNTKFVLANSRTATDTDFENIESVIAHEYFHNWTGNRVTCRDWFQLSLKEGLTVFRDQEFSSDRIDRAICRIENVMRLRRYQFTEDAGPMAHPVRPASYVEMNNFYTTTIYEKGSEVVRMYHTFLGEEGFQKGMKLYFQRHDGQAVTCDDFRQAMADANNFDFEQFALWYSQAGTPTLDATGHLNEDGSFILRIKQTIPPTPDMDNKQPMAMPIKIAFFSQNNGEQINFRLDGKNTDEKETVLLLNKKEQEFVFYGINQAVVPSLLRGFSAPVHLNYPYDDHDLSLLLTFDNDPFARWEAGQMLYRRAVAANVIALKNNAPLPKHDVLLHAIDSVLQANITPAFRAMLLTVPAEAELWAEQDNINPVLIYQARSALLNLLAIHFKDQIFALNLEAKKQEENANIPHPYEYSPEQANWRALRNVCRVLMLRAEPETQMDYVFEHYNEMAKNMTHEWGILCAINHHSSPKRNQLLQQFAEKFHDQDLVMDKYFTLIANSHRADTLEQVKAALNHPAFNLQNPNKARSLLNTFAQNVPHFHDESGCGYAFIADKIREINSFNPQVASRLTQTFEICKRLEPKRQALMRHELEKLAALPELSKDVRELVEKILN